MQRISWPDNKRFAFTFFDDADRGTVANASEVYTLLSDLGMRGTKSVWTLARNGGGRNGGETCRHPRYLEWVHRLRAAGHEIALHNVGCGTSTREETALGLEEFRHHFGDYPKSMAFHTGCKESLYWGDQRLGGVHRLLYDALTLYREHGRYTGEVEGSSLFWGDLCREKIKYVRNFTFGELNTLKSCPFMPYTDPLRPMVNYWFSATEGSDVHGANRALSERNQDRLEAEGGACILYVHFAFGFCRHGHPDRRFRSLVERLARKGGWYVPVSELLDHILTVRGEYVLTDSDRRALERRWLAHKIRVGSS